MRSSWSSPDIPSPRNRIAFLATFVFKDDAFDICFFTNSMPLSRWYCLCSSWLYRNELSDSAGTSSKPGLAKTTSCARWTRKTNSKIIHWVIASPPALFLCRFTQTEIEFGKKVIEFLSRPPVSVPSRWINENSTENKWQNNSQFIRRLSARSVSVSVCLCELVRFEASIKPYK